MNKSEKLDLINKEIEKCRLCKVNKSGMAVPGEGNPDASIVFVGEAPGRTEAATGRPFVGRSGKLLRGAIESIGLNTQEVFITSPVKYLPDYLTPTPEDILHGMSHLTKQLNVIDPKIIVLLGSVAARGVLAEKLKISYKHGTSMIRDGKTYFISYHPAAAIRFQKFKATFLEDFMKIKMLING